MRAAYIENPHGAHKSNLIMLSKELKAVQDEIRGIEAIAKATSDAAKTESQEPIPWYSPANKSKNIFSILPAMLVYRAVQFKDFVFDEPDTDKWCDWTEVSSELSTALDNITRVISEIQQCSGPAGRASIQRQLRLVEATRARRFNAVGFRQKVDGLVDQIDRLRLAIHPNKNQYHGPLLVLYGGCRCHMEIRDYLWGSLHQLSYKTGNLTQWSSRIEFMQLALDRLIEFQAQEDAEKKDRKEWEDEQILTKLWPVS